MPYRANQAFTTWINGEKRRFKQNAIVPEEIARKVLALTYDAAAEPEPKPLKRPAKKAAHVTD